MLRLLTAKNPPQPSRRAESGAVARLPNAGAPAIHRSRTGPSAAGTRSSGLAPAQGPGGNRRRHQRQRFGERLLRGHHGGGRPPVGIFTSPHLRDYRERIRVHDRLVSAAELVSPSSESRPRAARSADILRVQHSCRDAGVRGGAPRRLGARDRHGRPLGCGQCGRPGRRGGGEHRIRPSGISGRDHRGHRAREGGYFPASRPAVLGSRDMPGVVEEMARALGAPLKRPGAEYTYSREDPVWHFHGSRWNLPHLPAPALVGDMQYANAATAIAALEEIDARLAIPAAAVARGLAGVQLAARFQVIAPANPGAPTWILDVAHNPAAARVLGAICAISRAAGEPWRMRDFGRQGRNGRRGGTPRLRRCLVVRYDRRRSRPQRCRAGANGGEPGCSACRRGGQHVCGMRGGARGCKASGSDPHLRILSRGGAGAGLARGARRAATGHASRIYCDAPSHLRSS